MVHKRRETDPEVSAANLIDERGQLTAAEKFIRRLAASKKPIGYFFLGLGGVLQTAAIYYPTKPIMAISAMCFVGGAALVGGGSETLKPDSFERAKNEALRDRDAL